jgi:hypothetical protein
LDDAVAFAMTAISNAVLRSLLYRF